MSGLFGEAVAVPQRGGPMVDLRVYGDEFLARYETPDGYSVTEDEGTGLFSYAVVEGGRFRSTGIPASESPPRGLPRHLQEAPDQQLARFEQRYREIRPEGGNAKNLFTYGSNNGLLPGRQLHRGEITGLTILIDFDDVQTAITAGEVASLLNDDNYTANGNACSVREYFRRMSGDVLDFTNEVHGPFKLANRKSYYEDAGKNLVGDALEAAKAGGVDFSRYASQPDNIIDSIIILYAGEKHFKGALWPSSSSIARTYDGVTTNLYLKTGLGIDATGLRIGTLVHEAGHLLCRFPDLYDYGDRDGNADPSRGLGRYCSMAGGEKLDDERTPAPFCAYLRHLAGWCSNVVDLGPGGRFEASHGEYTTVHRYGTDKASEYFLVENRCRAGLDAHLPSSGLAIYQCDTEGSNEFEDGTPYKHYQVLLLQADGRGDLQANRNGGDYGDLFRDVAGVALSNTTKPNSKTWGGRDSGLRVNDIGPAGTTTGFTVATPAEVRAESS